MLKNEDVPSKLGGKYIRQYDGVDYTTKKDKPMKCTLYSLDLSHQLDEEKIVHLTVEDEYIAGKMKQDWNIFETKEAALSALQKIKEIL